jgi:hypothetical protein
MNVFSEFERNIERGFRRFADRMFGPADSDDLLLMHRTIVEQIGGRVQTMARGKQVFPYPRVTVTLISDDADRRALYQAAFADEGRLEKDIRGALEGAECKLPRGFAVEVKTAETGEGRFHIDYAVDRKAEAQPAAAVTAAAPMAAEGPVRLVTVKGKTAQPEFPLGKARVNIGRMEEIMDADQRVVRRNSVVFEEGDDTNVTVSRKHAHIRFEGGEYRVCDDGSEYGTRVFREGRSIEVPAGNRRGEKLRPGDEIYLGRACLRFEQ